MTMGGASSSGSFLPGAVSIGGLGKPELLAALREHGVQLNQAAEALFDDQRFTTLDRRHVVGIAAVTVSGLGFGEGATQAQLVARALESGLLECPIELGPHLRLQLRDQPDADARLVTRGRAPAGSLTVASAPLDDRDETAKGFYLRRVAGVSWLRGYWSWPGHLWSPYDVLVFSTGVAPA